MHRHPPAVVLVFSEAERIAARSREGGAVETAGHRPQDVAHHEAERPADRGVGAKAGPEAPALTCDVELAAYRPVHDHDLGRTSQCRRRRVGDVAFIEQRPHRGQHDGHVVGPAARHHGVDGHLLGVHRDLAGGHVADDVRGFDAARHEEFGDPLRRGREDGEAIGPAAVEVRLAEVHVIGILVAHGGQLHARDPPFSGRGAGCSSPPAGGGGRTSPPSRRASAPARRSRRTPLPPGATRSDTVPSGPTSSSSMAAPSDATRSWSRATTTASSRRSITLPHPLIRTQLLRWADDRVPARRREDRHLSYDQRS